MEERERACVCVYEREKNVRGWNETSVKDVFARDIIEHLEL